MLLVLDQYSLEFSLNAAFNYCNRIVEKCKCHFMPGINDSRYRYPYSLLYALSANGKESLKSGIHKKHLCPGVEKANKYLRNASSKRGNSNIKECHFLDQPVASTVFMISYGFCNAFGY